MLALFGVIWAQGTAVEDALLAISGVPVAIMTARWSFVLLLFWLGEGGGGLGFRGKLLQLVYRAYTKV